MIIIRVMSPINDLYKNYQKKKKKKI